MITHNAEIAMADRANTLSDGVIRTREKVSL